MKHIQNFQMNCGGICATLHRFQRVELVHKMISMHAYSLVNMVVMINIFDGKSCDCILPDHFYGQNYVFFVSAVNSEYGERERETRLEVRLWGGQNNIFY